MSNLQLIESYHAAIWSDKDLSAIDRCFHENVQVHSPVKPTQGTQQLKEIISKWYAGFPDLKVHWDDYICAGNKIVSQWHAQGHHDGDFMGIPATKKNIRYSGVSIYQLENGLVTEYWAYINMDHVIKQLS